MVEANGPAKTPKAATESASPGVKGASRRKLLISSNDFIHLNEGNIKNYYKISSCIGRGKSKCDFAADIFRLSKLSFSAGS